MKKLLSIFIVGLSLTIMSCAPSAEDAAKYNEQIVTKNQKIAVSMDSLFAALNSYDVEQIASQTEITKKRLVETKSAVKSLGDFHGDNMLSKPITSMLELYDSHINTKISRISQLYSIPDTAYTEDNRKEAETINQTIEKERKAALELVVKAQENFVAKYKLNFDNDTTLSK